MMVEVLGMDTARDKFDLSQIMYSKPFASPKNLMAVQTVRETIKQANLPKI